MAIEELVPRQTVFYSRRKWNVGSLRYWAISLCVLLAAIILVVASRGLRVFLLVMVTAGVVIVNLPSRQYRPDKRLANWFADLMVSLNSGVLHRANLPAINQPAASDGQRQFVVVRIPQSNGVDLTIPVIRDYRNRRDSFGFFVYTDGREQMDDAQIAAYQQYVGKLIGQIFGPRHGVEVMSLVTLQQPPNLVPNRRFIEQVTQANCSEALARHTEEMLQLAGLVGRQPVSMMILSINWKNAWGRHSAPNTLTADQFARSPVGGLHRQLSFLVQSPDRIVPATAESWVTSQQLVMRPDRGEVIHSRPDGLPYLGSAAHDLRNEDGCLVVDNTTYLRFLVATSSGDRLFPDSRHFEPLYGSQLPGVRIHTAMTIEMRSATASTWWAGERSANRQELNGNKITKPSEELRATVLESEYEALELYGHNRQPVYRLVICLSGGSVEEVRQAAELLADLHNTNLGLQFEPLTSPAQMQEALNLFLGAPVA